MNVSYEGIGYLAVTLPAGNCTEGHLCKLNPQGQCVACAEGDPFCGLVEAVDGENAAVQIEGFAEVRYTGDMPPKGYLKLSSNGKGGVKVDAAGKEYLAVAVDGSAATVTIKL